MECGFQMRAKDFGAAAKAVLAIAENKYSDIFPIAIAVSDKSVQVKFTQPMQKVVLFLDVLQSDGEGMLLISRDVLAEFAASCSKQPAYVVAHVRRNDTTVTCSLAEEGTLLGKDPNHTTRETPSVNDEAVDSLDQVVDKIRNTRESCEDCSVVLTPAAAKAMAQAAQSLGEVIEIFPHQERGRALVKVGKCLIMGLDAWGEERNEAVEYREAVEQAEAAEEDLPVFEVVGSSGNKASVKFYPLRGL